MSGSLDQAYHRALRFYPPQWQRDNADAVVGTLLDVADGQERTTIKAGERLHLAGSGVLEGIRIVVSDSARSWIATISLGIGMAFAVTFLLFTELTPAQQFVGVTAQLRFGPFNNPSALLLIAWMIGFLLALLGNRTATRVTMLAVIVGAVVLVAMFRLMPPVWFGLTSKSLAILGLMALGALAGKPLGARWLVVSTVGALGVILFVGSLQGSSLGGMSDPTGAERALMTTAIVSAIDAMVLGGLVAIVLSAFHLQTAAQSLLGALALWALWFLVCGAAGSGLGPIGVVLVWIAVAAVIVALVGRRNTRRSQPTAR